MNCWAISFKYRQGRNSVDVALKGDDRAIRVGLNMAMITLRGRIEQLQESGRIDPQLFTEALVVAGILEGAAI